MVGHDSHDPSLGLLANLQDRNNTQQTKETTMEQSPTYRELFEQLQTAQRDLTDKQVILDRVGGIAERNSNRLREALKTARQLIVLAKDNDDRFITDNQDSINQLVSFGMKPFTKRVKVEVSWRVHLEVEAEVPEDFDEEAIEIYMKEDVDEIIDGSFANDDMALDSSWNLDVETYSYNVEVL